MEAAQLIGVTKWLQARKSSQRVFLESSGIRSQVTALVSRCLEPASYSELLVRNGMKSLSYLLEKPVTYQDAPDLFCLDLDKEFDIEDIMVLAEPTKVVQASWDIPTN